jgi:uncharacterized protein YigA (DUF484 family)
MSLQPQQPSDVLEQQIADYLESHPDFFDRHLELLQQLELSHQSHGTPSLIERQVKSLREEAAKHRQRLEKLIAVAHENEELNRRLHKLTVTLIDTVDFDEAINALQDRLHEDFSAEAVELHLFSSADLEHNPDLDGFKTFLDEGKPWCGQLDPERRAYLFGPQADDVRSCSMIPIREEGVLGVLAIGSTDARRFQPNLGTDYLARMGEIVSKTLEVVSEPGF